MINSQIGKPRCCLSTLPSHRRIPIQASVIIVDEPVLSVVFVRVIHLPLEKVDDGRHSRSVEIANDRMLVLVLLKIAFDSPSNERAFEPLRCLSLSDEFAKTAAGSCIVLLGVDSIVLDLYGATGESVKL